MYDILVLGVQPDDLILGGFFNWEFFGKSPDLWILSKRGRSGHSGCPSTHRAAAAGTESRPRAVVRGGCDSGLGASL